ncbi:MAG: GNAT family N-acetyltransferase [Alphaproteobacteria bacterium]|nr:GNAT family N-acetyltransferase [Alphaproteobacteria bacterium]
MSVQRFGLESGLSAPAFLARHRAFLEADEAGNCLLLSILQRLSELDQPPPYHLAAATTARGAAAVLVWRSQRAMISRGPARALHTLADEVADRRLVSTGAVLPAPEGGAFLNRLSQRVKLHPVDRQHQRLHRLDRLVPRAQSTPGAMRAAVMAEVALFQGWLDHFATEAGIERTPGHAETLIGLRKLMVWQTDRPVAIAAIVGGTRHSQRIGLVFTPPAERGHGYATALVAALSRQALARSRFVTLVTDLANPISNHIYARLGYRPCGDIDTVALRAE